MNRLVVVHPDAATLAQAVASRLLTTLLDAQSVRRPVHLGLTGGTIGIASLAALAAHPARDAIDWTGVHLWWGDERFLPDGDRDRNETQAREVLLDRLVTLPPGHVHPVPPSDRVASPEESAVAYADTLRAHAPRGSAQPTFDVLLLGMGPDGHVASLFPGFPQVEASGSTTAPVHDAPKPPPVRVTLTFEAIHAAREVWVAAAGAEKAHAVARALNDDDIHATPATGALGIERTLWLVDATAAGR